MFSCKECWEGLVIIFITLFLIIQQLKTSACYADENDEISVFSSYCRKNYLSKANFPTVHSHFAVIMADPCNTYQSVLKKLEDFLKTDREKTEKRLTTLREMSEILASTIAEKGDFEGEESEVDKCLVLILELCGTLLFGPYTAFLIQVSLKSNMVNEIEKKQKEKQSSALPKFMQAKYDQIKRYLEKAKGQLKKIDDMLPELVKKVRSLLYYLLHAA